MNDNILRLNRRSYAAWLGIALVICSQAVFANHHERKTIDVSDDVAAIEKLYADWRVAVEASDIPGYVASLHPDIHMFPPGAPRIVGANNYAKFLIPVFAVATYKIDVVQLPLVTVKGDIAVVEYHYTINLKRKDEGVGVSEQGAMTASSTTARYFDVLTKEHGKWQIWRHTWQTYEL